MLIFNDILIPGRRGVRSLIAADVDILIFIYIYIIGCLKKLVVFTCMIGIKKQLLFLSNFGHVLSQLEINDISYCKIDYKEDLFSLSVYIFSYKRYIVVYSHMMTWTLLLVDYFYFIILDKTQLRSKRTVVL